MKHLKTILILTNILFLVSCGEDITDILSHDPCTAVSGYAQGNEGKMIVDDIAFFSYHSINMEGTISFLEDEDFDQFQVTLVNGIGNVGEGNVGGTIISLTTLLDNRVVRVIQPETDTFRNVTNPYSLEIWQDTVCITNGDVVGNWIGVSYN